MSGTNEASEFFEILDGNLEAVRSWLFGLSDVAHARREAVAASVLVRQESSGLLSDEKDAWIFEGVLTVTFVSGAYVPGWSPEMPLTDEQGEPMRAKAWVDSVCFERTGGILGRMFRDALGAARRSDSALEMQSHVGVFQDQDSACVQIHLDVRLYLRPRTWRLLQVNSISPGAAS